MLARFVVNSHVKHHPNAVNNDDENEDEEAERVCQNRVPFYCEWWSVSTATLFLNRTLLQLFSAE